MIMYNVTVVVDHDIHEKWLQWMKETHIPDVLATENLLRVFPNPSENYIVLEYHSIQPELIQIGIYNTLGQRAWWGGGFQSAVGENQYVVDLPNLAPGFYIARISGAEVRAAIKFLMK